MNNKIIIDVTKNNAIYLSTSASLSAKHVHFDVLDMRWNPFNIRGCHLNSPQDLVKHKVEVTELYLPPTELVKCAGKLKSFYENHETDFNDIIGELVHDTIMMNVMDGIKSDSEDGTLVDIVNNWIGVIKHFGNDAPYRRNFIRQMEPITEELAAIGIDISKLGDVVVNKATGMISIPATAIAELIHAFQGPDHLIMELKYTMNVEKVMPRASGRNPVNVLLECWHQRIKELNKE